MSTSYNPLWDQPNADLLRLAELVSYGVMGVQRGTVEAISFHVANAYEAEVINECMKSWPTVDFTVDHGVCLRPDPYCINLYSTGAP